MIMKHKTISAYLSGSICGKMWWPVGELGSINIREDLRSKFDRFTDAASFRDALDSILMEQGGDFSGSQFTPDTVVRIERRKLTPQGYEVHIWERPVSEIWDCSDLVNQTADIATL
jgi:hypothetical protein